MTANTQHRLVPDMASLLVRLNPKASEHLAQLMRELATHRDMDSMRSLGDAIKAAPAGTIHSAVVLEAVFAPVGWGSKGSEDEKKFEAEWVAKWQPKPSLALEGLMNMAANVKKLDNKDQVIDVDRMVAMIEIAAPLVKNKGASVASVFSPFVEQMISFVDRSNEKREKAALSVIEKVLALDPKTVFRPETSTPTFDLSKRSKNAHPDSAEGLTFEVSSHNIVGFLNAKNIPVQSKEAFLGLLEKFYPPKLLQAQGLDYIRSEAIDVSIAPGMEAHLLKRGWLDQAGANELFTSPVTDAVYMNGAEKKFKSVYAVALASKSLQLKDFTVDVLNDFQAAGVDLDQKISCDKGALTFNGRLLHFAAMEASADFVGVLVKNGCDTTAKMTSSVTATGVSRGKDGFTPMQLAAFELDKCQDDPAKAPMRNRFEGVLSVLRSQNARAVAHQLLDDMDLNSQSLTTRGTIGHAPSARS